MQRFDEEMENYIWSLDGGLWGTLQDAGLALGAVFSLLIVARIAYRAMILEEGIDIIAILRPVLIAFVLANWYWVTTCLHSLTEPIEDSMKYMYEYQANELGRLRDRRSAASLDVMGSFDSVSGFSIPTIHFSPPGFDPTVRTFPPALMT